MINIKTKPHTLIFLHIPKTAGVTFGEFLAKQYSETEMARYKTIVPLSEYYWQIYQHRDEFRFLRGHFPFGLHQFVRSPFLYLTFLRDPIDRATSLYYFFKEWDESPIYEKVRKMSFIEFMESGISFFADNGQVRLLSGAGNKQAYGECTREMLTAAKENLEQYFLVGLVEEFDKSLQFFAEVLGWSDTHYEKQNVTSNRPAKEEIPQETLAIIKKYNQLDLELYEFAKKLFSRQFTTEMLVPISNQDKFISYAQNQEDIVLWRALKHIEQGFYIDAGAWSPDADSVTRAFYERGWHGINIEPNPTWHQRLKERRPNDLNLPVLLSNQEETLEFYINTNETGLSTADIAYAQKNQENGYQVEKISRQAITLNEIWETKVLDRAVHFLKIDVEGAEEKVIAGNNWQKNRPWIVLVEATLPNTQIPTHDTWEHFLLENDYKYIYSDGLNRYYLAKEHAELEKHFSLPPNIFDNFETATYAKAKHERTLFAAQNQQLSKEKQQLSKEKHQLANEKQQLIQQNARLKQERSAASRILVELEKTRIYRLIRQVGLWEWIEHDIQELDFLEKEPKN
ncbi:MAG: hypothetical protein DRI32_00670 [Chloroflexi bacterium]|nr:MAG: hypothetical protein DRI32_00670 [Chloroflexota bacterium]